MKNYFFFIFILFATNNFAGSQSDTARIVFADDLTYHSDFEREMFAGFLSGSDADYMGLALATDHDYSPEAYQICRNVFYSRLDKISSDKNFQKNPKKQIGFVFDELHDEFLTLYDENPLFSEIFSTGKFNCVTASVMFALAFDYLDIPYEIKLLPNHAYVLAYPQSESLIVETTNPLSGATINIDSREKYKSVQELIKLKLVLQEEVDEKGIDRMFSDYYLGVETLTLDQLIGALYLNAGLADLSEYDYKSAYGLITKSAFLWPKKTTIPILLLCATTILEQRNYHEPVTFRALADLEKFVFMGIPETAIAEEFLIFIEGCMQRDDISGVDSVYTYLTNKIRNQKITDEISFYYYYDLAVYKYEQSSLDEAVENIGKALEYKPDDKNTRKMLVDILLERARSCKTLFESYDLIREYRVKYSALTDNEDFLRFNQAILLDIINVKYGKRDFKEAEQYRQEFEQTFPPDDSISGSVIVYLQQVYSVAAMYYFKENSIGKAKAVLQSGLKYAPESYELQSKLNALK